MNRRHAIAVLIGLAFVAIGVPIGFDGEAAWSWSADVAFGVFLVGLVAFAIGCWKIRGTLDGADAAAVSWAETDSFADPAPERTDREPPLSSDAFAGVIEEAGAAAREGTVDDGLAVVRPALRTALLEALVQGGRSRSAVEAALADGSWTDDRIAASVLDEAVRPPDRPFRERLRAWLFPERVVRERSRRATAEVAAVADEALPTVPGQTAPRTKPVLQPRLEDLTRGADGELQRAVDPTAIARGPRPPRPALADAGTEAENDGNGAQSDENRDDGRDSREDRRTDHGRSRDRPAEGMRS